jgi:prepilin-type N-terminal cleavage/methylation domain-containing protein
MRARRPSLAAQDGFTLIEVLAALLLLTVGIFAVATTFDFSRASTDQSELKTSAIDRAQREIEAIRSLPYDQVAHPTGGILAASSDPKDPTSRISGTSFKWNRASSSASEPLVTSATGTVPMKQTIARGEEDRFGYAIWRFVTKTTEPACASAVACETGGSDYRRVTVVVRASGLGETLNPVWTSTTVIDPAAAANNEGQPQTLCQNDEGNALELCSTEVDDVPRTFYLTNTAANLGNVRQAIPAAAAQRALHKTVRVPSSCTASSSNGCPIPDLMVETSLPMLDPESVPAPVSFATDVTPAVAAGRPLNKDTVACGGTPSRSDDLKGAYWVSPPLSEAVDLTGKGTLRLYSRTWTESEHVVKLCGVVYDVPATINNPVPTANVPTQIGQFTTGTLSWPTSFQPVTAEIRLGLSQEHAVLAGRRIGLRLWVDGASGDDIVVLYDHNDHESSLTMMTKEEE